MISYKGIIITRLGIGFLEVQLKKFSVSIMNISEYRPGRALNSCIITSIAIYNKANISTFYQSINKFKKNFHCSNKRLDLSL